MTLARAVLTAIVVAAAVGAQGARAAAQPPADTGAAMRAPPLPLDTALERRTTAVASQLRCVVCQGLSIQDSPSELAVQMRGVVRDQLAAGKSEREVVDYFVSKYGEWVLLSPRPEGFNLVAYILPMAFLVGGVVAVVLAVRRWSAQSAAGIAGDEATPGAARGDDPRR